MANEQLKELVSELLKATKKGGLKWQETAREDAFRVGLGDGMVRIQTSIDESDGEPYQVLYLMNRQGRVVDELTGTGANYGLLHDLYAEARSSALKLEDVVNSMLADLRDGKTRELPPDGDEMAPF